MSVDDTLRASPRPPDVPVWDPVVRFGHWALAAAFTVAYLTAEEETGSPDLLHVWGGYAVAAIVAFRVLWGFVGPQHARFSDFVRGPLAIVGYLKDLILGGGKRYLGHSPAGGAMVITLLVFLAATATSGMLAYGAQGKGPLSIAPTLVKSASADDDENRRTVTRSGEAEGKESAIAEIHGALANITLVLVVVHILGVGLVSLVHRENLVVAMITGRKRSID